jgi:hypothetical protein
MRAHEHVAGRRASWVCGAQERILGHMLWYDDDSPVNQTQARMTLFNRGGKRWPEQT